MKRPLILLLFFTSCTIMCAQDSRNVNQTLSLSPAFLVKPVVRVSYEYRLSADEGFELSALGGRMSGWPAWGFAFHYVYYLVCDFEHGMPFGFGYTYTKVADPTDPIGNRDRGIGQWFHLGYKYTHVSGFTAALMGSAGIVGTGGGGPNVQPLADLRGALALNLQMGWSL